MRKLLERLWYDEDGVTMTETALILVLVSIVAIAALQVLGTSISDIFEEISDTLGEVGDNGNGDGNGEPTPE